MVLEVSQGKKESLAKNIIQNFLLKLNNGPKQKFLDVLRFLFVLSKNTFGDTK